jgi:hypothetical protein
MKTVLLVSLLGLVVFTYSLRGQAEAVNRENYRLQASKINEVIEVDGILDEGIWARAKRTSPFFRITPIDTGYAKAQTEVMVAYDDKNIYMGIICHDTLPGKRPMESYRRDWSFGKNDNFFAAIDTYNDQTNGFACGVSAAGASGMGSNPRAATFPWNGMASGIQPFSTTTIAGWPNSAFPSAPYVTAMVIPNGASISAGWI